MTSQDIVILMLVIVAVGIIVYYITRTIEYFLNHRIIIQKTTIFPETKAEPHMLRL